MASAYHRLLDLTLFTENDRQPLFKTWDAGQYTTLVIHVRVPNGNANAGAKLILEHAAVNDNDAFVPLQANGQNVEVGLDNVGAPVYAVSAFLRYLRWRVDGFTSNDALALIDVIAKD